MPDFNHYSGGSDKTIAKLVILRQYLWAYEQIMKNQWDGEKWYIDTHSGTGKTEISDYNVVVRGSALRALDYDFDGFFFYELDSDHFETLCQTIEEELDIKFEYGTIGDTDSRKATNDDPKIQVLNMDANKGVEWLIKNSNKYRHWFVFIDPERLTVEDRLIKKLIDRSRTDILLNFQTRGILRSAAEGAEHAHTAVDRVLGEGWPIGADEDEYVRFFKEQMFSDTIYEAISRKMVAEGSKQWRYDLVFASRAGVAEKIMSQIMERSLRDKIKEEIIQARATSESSQRGMEDFVIKMDDHEAGKQSGLDDYL